MDAVTDPTTDPVEALAALSRSASEGTAAAVRRFVDAAGDAGLIDVAVATVESPVGPLLLAAGPRGLLEIDYVLDSTEDLLGGLARRISPRVVEAPARLDGVRRELDEYFAGRRRSFSVPVDLTRLGGFGRRVLEATARIPYGSVGTYRSVATAAGSPRAVRAAGNALGANPIPIVIPCHRILRSDGSLGGYTGGLDKKSFLLSLEGRATT